MNVNAATISSALVMPGFSHAVAQAGGVHLNSAAGMSLVSRCIALNATVNNPLEHL